MFEEVAPFKDESKFDRHQSSQAAGAVTPASSDTLSSDMLFGKLTRSALGNDEIGIGKWRDRLQRGETATASF